MTKRENITTVCGISQITDPAKFYDKHSEELALVGADAFGQDVESFEPQVRERFSKATMAQIMRHGRQIMGFALYDTISGSHWRLTFYRG
jgi:predicted ThiF/HesA family dinucleotide-utilizing enzyme